MSDSAKIKMVPALCTQCGGALTVDPSKETADCPFCGSSFIVEKAINQYQVQHATFEHVDNVNIDMSGTVNSVLDFVGKQMSEGREFKRELRKEEKEHAAENRKQFFMTFLKIGLPLLIILFIIAMVMNAFLETTAGKAQLLPGREMKRERSAMRSHGDYCIWIFLSPGDIPGNMICSTAGM